MASNDFVTGQNFRFYLVYADQENERHHGLHTNTAPFLLTFAPESEDRIYAVGNVQCAGTADGHAYLEAWVSYRGKKSLFHKVAVRIGSHPGRSALLGEDGLEDAYGNPCLLDLMTERIGYAVGATEPRIDQNGKEYDHPLPPQFFLRSDLDTWGYAPVQAEALSDDAYYQDALEAGEYKADYRGNLHREPRY